jgi:DNA-directed RNA polymerase specialized sigma24 family protein
MLEMMGELSDKRADAGAFEPFAERWFAPLVGVFLRSVRHPALAYDLATETLAAAWLQWDVAPSGDEAVDWLLRLAAQVLDATVERKRVPSIERRRGHPPTSRRLSVAEQRQIAALAEDHIELPVSARDAADALARMAPPPNLLTELRLSGLVEADPLPDHERDPHGN